MRKTSFREITMRMATYFAALLLVCSFTQSMPLLGGRFVTSTNVTGYLNLALDISEIRQTIAITDKIKIYRKVSIHDILLLFPFTLVPSNAALCPQGRNAYTISDKGQK